MRGAELSCNLTQKQQKQRKHPSFRAKRSGVEKSFYAEALRREKKISHRLHRFSRIFQSDDKLCSQASGLHGAGRLFLDSSPSDRNDKVNVGEHFGAARCSYEFECANKPRHSVTSPKWVVIPNGAKRSEETLSAPVISSGTEWSREILFKIV